MGAFLPVLFYGLATHTYYLHYVSALLPTLLLMVGFYFFLAWLDEPAKPQADTQLSLLFVSGLALGTAPWCKLQAAPIACALALVVLAAIFRERGRSFSLSSRAREVIVFCAGAILTTCIMLTVLAKTGAINEFWHSYILGNLAAAGPLSLAGVIENFLLLFLVWPFRQPLLVSVLGIGLLLHASRSGDIHALLQDQKMGWHRAFGVHRGCLVRGLQAALFCRHLWHLPDTSNDLLSGGSHSHFSGAN